MALLNLGENYKMSTRSERKTEGCGFVSSKCPYCIFWTQTSEALAGHIRAKHVRVAVKSLTIERRSKPFKRHLHKNFPSFFGTELTDYGVRDLLAAYGRMCDPSSQVFSNVLDIKCEGVLRSFFCSICGFESPCDEELQKDHLFNEHLQVFQAPVASRYFCCA
jgi:hypothetical protein